MTHKNQVKLFTEEVDDHFFSTGDVKKLTF